MFFLKKKWKKSKFYSFFSAFIHFLGVFLIAWILISLYKKDLILFIDGIILATFAISPLFIQSDFLFDMQSHFKKIKTLMTLSNYTVIFYFTILFAFFVERLPKVSFTKKEFILLLLPFVFLFSLKIFLKIKKIFRIVLPHK